MTVSPAEQEYIEAILAERAPNAEIFLDFDADGSELPSTRPYDVIISLGPAFTSLDTRDGLKAAFRTFAAHARYGTQLIVRMPPGVSQTELEGCARSYRWFFYVSLGELRVFGFGFNTVEDPWDHGF